LIGWMFVVLAGTGSLATAQTAQRSTIEGTVVDSDGGAVADATVTLSGPRLLGGTRTVTSDASGYFRFSDLLPGTYDVVATAPGFESARRDRVALPVETTYTVPLTLPLPGVSERVDVSSRATLIDVRTSAMPTLLAETALHDLPTARTLGGLLALAPGVVTTTPLYGFVGEVSYGGTQGGNGFTLDGVNLTESLRGTPWSQPHYNWLEEAQVTGLGAPAEYGGSTGATINGVLRSGSNRIGALGELLTIRPTWSGDNLGNYPANVDKPIPPRRIMEWWDGSGQLGGPLVRDHLFAFGGYSQLHHEYGNYGHDGPAHTDERTSKAIFKLDATVTSRLLAQAFVTRHSSDVIGAWVSQYSPTYESSPDDIIRTNAWNLRLSAILSPTTLLEARTSGHHGTETFQPHPPATLEGPSPSSDVDTGLPCCNSFYRREERGATLGTLTLSHHREHLAGRHDFKAGVEFERAPVDTNSSMPTGRRLYTSHGAVVQVEEWAGDHTHSTARRSALYLQDRWAVGERLTIEPGLRAEFNSGSVPGGISNFETAPVALRLGAAWDVTGRQKTVVRAHYGRYHDPLLGDVYSYTQPNAHSPHVFYAVVDGALVEQFRYIEEYNLPAPTRFKQSHVDEWTAGVEHALTDGMTVEGRYIARRFGHFIGWIDERIDDWTPYQVQDPGPDGLPGTGDDGGMFTIYQSYGNGIDVSDRALRLGNPAGASRRYDGVQFIATRRFTSNWQGQISYTWSRSRGTVDNPYLTNATYGSMNPGGYGANPGARAQPPAPPLYDYSEFKALGSYRVPFWGGFMASGVFRWHSGTHWQRDAVVFSPFFASFPVEPLGSRRTPSLGGLDLRVEKTLRLSRGTLGLYGDLLNATNVGRATAYNSRSGPQFGQVNGWTDPRTGRLGVRDSF
jgi:hypothetical protein